MFGHGTPPPPRSARTAPSRRVGPGVSRRAPTKIDEGGVGERVSPVRVLRPTRSAPVAGP
ncbi:hypothetical protein F750_5319 [Streptomyces sp. PAMC 26508]|nr:hypothetical protein F750_5319 [Streptomyces sp. PAMC 26508]